MGSPYVACELIIDDDWPTLLPKHGWQDKIARSPDNRFIGLVRWDTRDNTPGFRILILDTEIKQGTESQRIEGCCDALLWRRNGVTYCTFDGHEGEFTV